MERARRKLQSRLEEHMTHEKEVDTITTFQAAIGVGEEYPLGALESVLSELKEDFTVTPDLNALARNIRSTIHILPPHHPDDQHSESAHKQWEDAVRWTLPKIREWGAKNQSQNTETLRSIVTAAFTLDLDKVGLRHIAASVVTERVSDGLSQLLSEHMFVPFMKDERQQQAHDEIFSRAIAGDYKRILPRYHHLFYGPGGDFYACVTLLHATYPAKLASIIERKNDINFCGLVNAALGKRALRFATEVSNNAFKFACLAPFLHENRVEIPDGYDAPLGQILKQVAESSSDDWNGWMRAFIGHPGGYLVLETALASVLPELGVEHWDIFLKALDLDYSQRGAAPFANLMIRFGRTAGDQPFGKMCHMAYQIWDKWDYRDSDSQSFMFAPRACSLDFPVAMAYAGQSAEYLASEEARLIEAIDSLENQWFDSSSALLDERYRLMSRLRLLRHGVEIKNGSKNALPQKIEQDGHPYYQARYAFSPMPD